MLNFDRMRLSDTLRLLLPVRCSIAMNCKSNRHSNHVFMNDCSRSALELLTPAPPSLFGTDSSLNGTGPSNGRHLPTKNGSTVILVLQSHILLD